MQTPRNSVARRRTTDRKLLGAAAPPLLVLGSKLRSALTSRRGVILCRLSTIVNRHHQIRLQESVLWNSCNEIAGAFVQSDTGTCDEKRPTCEGRDSGMRYVSSHLDIADRNGAITDG